MSDTFVELAATGGGTGLDGVDGYPHSWAGAFPPRPLEQTQAGSTVATAELFAGSLAELALTVRHVGTQDEQQALAVIADAAVTVLGGAEQAAVVALAGPDRLTTRSAHGELIPLVVELGNELGQGPLLEAARQRAVIVVDDLSTENAVAAVQCAGADARCAQCSVHPTGRRRRHIRLIGPDRRPACRLHWGCGGSGGGVRRACCVGVDRCPAGPRPHRDVPEPG